MEAGAIAKQEEMNRMIKNKKTMGIIMKIKVKIFAVTHRSVRRQV
jgi:hypothetical protein